MSQIAIVGNMTGPVDVRYTKSGKAVGTVSVAVNRKRGDVEETDFHRVTLWQELAENAAQLVKGTRVIVVGRLSSRPWETDEGEKRTAWEITADSFGPDLRWATVEVTRTSSRQAGPAASAGAQWSAREPGDGSWAVGGGEPSGDTPF